MTYLTTTMMAAQLAALALSLPAGALAAGDGKPFAVQGERIEITPPADWKLAWMDGAADGAYVAEYIPQVDDINSWRGGYLAVERLQLPPADVMKKVADAKLDLSSLVLSQFMQKTQKTCPGKNESMPHRSASVNGIPVSLSGGFCDRYGDAAPFGEGGLVAFAQGRDYYYRVQFSWRPTTQDQSATLPWHIAPEQLKSYADALQALSLCGGGAGQPACRLNYVGP